MCGFVGIWNMKHESDFRVSDLISSMTHQISHRGPDSEGIWINSTGRVALGHRRLSIIDLSASGAQPMSSKCGRYVFCLNGEIYNYQDIRVELEKGGTDGWRGHSDTEVALEAIRQWGINYSINKFDGMFAFALWDNQEQTITLARDRFGEKPLYYGEHKGRLIFGSELKAITLALEKDLELDEQSVSQYFTFGYIPSPRSIYKKISKLPAGSLLSISNLNDINKIPTKYWSLRSAYELGRKNPYDGDEEDAANEIETKLKGVINKQMLADVPVGAFLSGGIDSSLVVSLMRLQSNKQIKTFTIGFSDSDFDESDRARKVASLFGTDHTELIVDAQHAINCMDRIARTYDEPFGDSSSIPTMLVCELAKTKVTVALSGDGGDEFFGGYNHYRWGVPIIRSYGRMNNFSRKLFSSAIRLLSSTTLFDKPQIRKISEIFGSDLPGAHFWGLTGRIGGTRSLNQNAKKNISHLASFHQRAFNKDADIQEELMIRDGEQFLTDDILVKLDRAAMSCSLETRAPFLDHKLVEFFCSLPHGMKIRNGKGKWILRKILNKHVPTGILCKKKKGFGIPVSKWIRHEMRDWSESLLNKKAIERTGVLSYDRINFIWNQHLNGNSGYFNEVWDALMFQQWDIQRQHNNIL
jgi:asparagine synthase (glutamine-hydrolysing)